MVENSNHLPTDILVRIFSQEEIDGARQRYLRDRQTLPEGGLRLKKLLHLAYRFPDYTPHPQTKEIQDETLAWAKKFGILMKNNSHNHMGPCIDAHASKEDALLNNKIYYLLFWIDDTIANDTFRLLSPEDAKRMHHDVVKERLKFMLENGELPPNPMNFELALMDIFRQLADPERIDQRWLHDFVKELRSHLHNGTTDYDSAAWGGHVWTEQEYRRIRRFVSGMNVTKLLTRRSTGMHVSQLELANIGLLHDVQKLEHLVEDIGAIANDLISCEKEISNGTDFNYIEVVRAQHGFSFRRAIHYVADIVNNDTEEFLQRIDAFIPKIVKMFKNGQIDISVYQYLKSYLQGMIDTVAATWMYQLTSDRYKSLTSPYEELKIN